MVENSCSSSTVAQNGLLGESRITGVASVRTTVGTSVIAESTSRPNTLRGGEALSRPKDRREQCQLAESSG